MPRVNVPINIYEPIARICAGTDCSVERWVYGALSLQLYYHDLAVREFQEKKAAGQKRVKPSSIYRRNPKVLVPA